MAGLVMITEATDRHIASGAKSALAPQPRRQSSWFPNGFLPARTQKNGSGSSLTFTFS